MKLRPSWLICYFFFHFFFQPCWGGGSFSPPASPDPHVHSALIQPGQWVIWHGGADARDDHPGGGRVRFRARWAAACCGRVAVFMVSKTITKIIMVRILSITNNNSWNRIIKVIKGLLKDRFENDEERGQTYSLHVYYIIFFCVWGG